MSRKHLYYHTDTDWYNLTDYERSQIFKQTLPLFSDEEETCKSFLESGHVKKVHNYTSDGPGFVGSIFFIVFGGGPETAHMITHYAPDSIHESWAIHSINEEPLKGE